MDNLNLKEEIAVFAGGCFWCTEPVFSQLIGVRLVTSGYIGGHTPNPTYKDICRGDTGHAEAILIHFNPQHISYETLLEIFFSSHDPTTLNRQGNDIGTQYRLAIFCQSSLQKSAAIECISRLDKAGIWPDPIVTQVNDAETFYPAEDYHQHYFAKNPFQPYCLAVAAPKAAKIREKYAYLIKKTDANAFRTRYGILKVSLLNASISCLNVTWRNVSSEIRDKAIAAFGGEVIESRISENVTVAESPSNKQDIFSYNRNGMGAANYVSLLEE